MRYYVTFKVDGRCVVSVDAGTVEEARAAALSSFGDESFGNLEVVDFEDIMAEDEDGNYVWER